MNNQLKRKIHCSICNKPYFNLANHIKTHRITVNEYREKFGETSYKRIIIQKINRLFITTRHKWISGYSYLENGDLKTSYRTNKKDRAGENTHLNDRYLNDTDISRHLDFKHVVGIFPPPKFTSFFCFDIDGKEGEKPYELAKSITLDVIDELKHYFNEKDIHVVFSGNKGYHVWLFFNRTIETKDVLAFAKMIASFNAGNIEVEIEFRPESNDGKAIKLPLGKHIKTGSFCGFVDKKTLEPVKNSYEYLMSIEKSTPIYFKMFISEEKVIKKERKVLGEKRNSEQLDYNFSDYDSEYIDNIYKNGLPHQGTRNHYMFPITILLKDKYKLTLDQAIEELIVFTDCEYQAERTKDDAKKSKSSIEKTVANVYSKDLHLLSDQKLNNFEESLISLSTIYLSKNNKREREYSERIEECFREVLKLGKTWHINGFFFISTPYLAHRLGCDERTIQRYLKHLSKTFLIFRAIEGVNNHLLYEEMKKAAEPYCKQVPEFKVWFDKQNKPAKGYNSLYFCPFIIPNKRGEYRQTLTNEDIERVGHYGVISWFLKYLDSEEIFFKYEILFENRRYINAIAWEKHVEKVKITQSHFSGEDRDFIKNLRKIKDVIEESFKPRDTIDMLVNL